MSTDKPKHPLVPQFATSTNPAVIAALEHNNAEFARFLEIAKSVSLKYTGDETRGIGNTGPGRPYLSGLRVDRDEFENLPGQWTKRNKGITAPYKADPAYQDFRIKVAWLDIPGRPDVAWGENHLGSGALFLHDGAAYSGFNFLPRDRNEQAGLWTEITASAFHQAADAYDAHRAGQPAKEES